MAVVQNFTCFKGEDVLITFQMTDPAVDISGWTIMIYLRVKTQYPTTPPQGTLLASNLCTVQTATTFDAPLSAADTTTAPGVYEWATWRTDPGNNTTLALGDLTITDGVKV